MFDEEGGCGSGVFGDVGLRKVSSNGHHDSFSCEWGGDGQQETGTHRHSGEVALAIGFASAGENEEADAVASSHLMGGCRGSWRSACVMSVVSMSGFQPDRMGSSPITCSDPRGRIIPVGMQYNEEI